ncbi:uncharacterized protein LOC111020890 [Momordica charantia]|uniref:Uncharacterized protein LOC111020890 n=1 Tax=Momordica charantia TaxID=3673 RepID=A0A6J1DIR1_MOMCH|nr:uncharacterized protein LOC111020890 [Momordica charantia]XP_022153380.1 uncharacterized protein LOC111020890 [Momordica charantia]XP_022153381.1 uncharacterized protein LOC111020890 [Momordica charantia]XP_022153382.1 uncharacterized protein LOC111020890 [Momordica charantia]
MDSPSTTPSSAPNSSPVSNPGSNDENPRVKFLCSFLGSIMPRPQDGKLRYVGGETRIVSVPRDITYEELMLKMRELYEGAAVLKYQQPDEDLDALVSVVNDDDVINMMEEYDKVGSGDGFTRLRIFLFSHPDQDGSLPFVDGDERDTERRYVDALNNSNEMNDFARQQQPDSPVISGMDDMHGMEHFLNPMNIEGSLHTQRSCEPLSQYHLHQLTVPHAGSGQQQQSVAQRYNEMEAPWSPAYLSPRHHGHFDPRPVGEYPSSPSRYRMPFPDVPDKYLERMPEEYARQQMSHQHMYEHQPQYNENVVWLPNGAISEKSGFPGNILHGHGVLEGNSSCEHCRGNFHRYQTPMEQGNMLNGLPTEYPQNREAFIQKADAKFHHGIFPNEQNMNDHRSAYNETPPHERGWIMQHQLNVRGDDTRAHVSGAGRLNDHYIVDGSGSNFPPAQSNLADGYHSSMNFHDEVFRDQVVPSGSHMGIPPPEERGVGYMNMPYAYGGDPQYPPMAHRHMPGNSLWRNVQNPVHVATPYEASMSLQQGNTPVNPGYIRGMQEGSPRVHIGMDHQNPWHESSQKLLGIEGATGSEHVPAHALNTNSTAVGHDNQRFSSIERIQPQLDKINLVTSPEVLQRSNSASVFMHDKLVAPFPSSQNPLPRAVSGVNEAMTMEGKILHGEGNGHVITDVGRVNIDAHGVSHPEQNNTDDTYSKVALPESLNSNGMNTPVENGDGLKPAEDPQLSVNRLRFLPELIASVKRAALEVSEDAIIEETALARPDSMEKKETENEPDSLNAHGEPELDTDNDHQSSRIEPTKAEAEAISRGLQTIKNDDLEEIRELGSGTYGAVYHGKWRGSDVAIKRIKASCFAGRPSERERLIADFWKEALILSSLHHPNVVSFYGIVRDGPDGSLATVTEFMVNGSLKQFLHKKDRTIDRRKRLIIAMDAAFGMEYLHGKNIVHFDLKCENLLVNMRDPQRPVCKIGDLGLSKVRQHTLVSGGVRGTLPWMAPELLSGKSNMVTEKIDVYSFGIVMWELLTGDEPYADMHCASIIGGIVNNSLRPEIPTWCDPEWKALMSSCWDSEPAMRPSFSEISQKLRNMAAAMNVK